MRKLPTGGREAEVPDEVAGRLLVATPVIGDGNFDQAVILMLEFGDEGALGVVINQPMHVPVFEILPSWSDGASEPNVMFRGGPVSARSVIALGECVDPGTVGGKSIPNLSPLCTIDLDTDPALALAEIENLRVFSGYSGWSAGQLEGEIRAGAWFVCDAQLDDVTTAEPGALWAAVLARQRDTRRWFAHHPDDLGAN